MNRKYFIVYMTYASKQLFYINSYFRTANSASSSDFHFYLDIDPLSEYDRISILDASIPKSNYAVISPHNTFDVIEDSGTRTITLPEGNYSRRGFKNVIEPLLNGNLDGYVYTVNYDNIRSTVDTGKYTFAVTGGIIQPTFVFDHGMWNNMGFNKSTSYAFSGGTLTAPNVMNFRSQDTFFILSDIVQNRGDNVLAHIISNQNEDFEHVNFKNHSVYEYSKDFSKMSSNVYHFRIVNESLDPIDLNGVDCFFTLMIYKKNNIDNLIKGFIKYKTMKDE